MHQDQNICRRTRIERAIEDQKAFLHRVPDPDTREKAEAHLLTLVQMREAIGPEGQGQFEFGAIRV